MGDNSQESLEEDRKIVPEKESEDSNLCLTSIHEIRASESDTDSDDSSAEDLRERGDKQTNACAEHSSLKRLGQRMKESMISMKRGVLANY